MIHCDSDDWVDMDMYRVMYEEAILNNADIIVCDLVCTDGSIERRMVDMANTISNDFFYNVLVKKSNPSLCNKLIKSSLFDNYIEFPTCNMGEDHALLIQLAYFCTNVVKLDKPLYYYYQNNQSITKLSDKEGTSNRYAQSIGNAEAILRFMKSHGLDKIYSNELTRLLLHKKNLIRPLISEKKYYHLWINTFKEINSKILFNPCVTLAEKIKFILSYMKLYKNAN